MSRRTRGAALIGLSAACAGLAVSLMNDYARDVRAQVGPLVPVVVARKSLPPGRVVTPAVALSHLVERRIPARFLSPDSLRSPQDAIGLHARRRILPGSYISHAHLGSPPVGRAAPKAGGEGAGRLVEIPVAGGAALREVLRPGVRVDVLVTSERGPGPPRTYLALQRLLLADIRVTGSSGPVAGSEQSEVDTIAALRVTLRQAILLTAAQNFARELRLVPRVPGDARVFPPTTVSAGDLHP